MLQTILFLLAYLTAVQADPLSLCSSSSSAFDFKSISFSPSAVAVGRDLQVRASGFLSVAVSPGANFRLVLKFGPIKVFENSGYTCDPNAGKDCYTPGFYDDFEAIFPIPKNVPLRKFHVQVDFMNGDGSPITCIQGDIQFTSALDATLPNDFSTYDEIYDDDVLEDTDMLQDDDVLEDTDMLQDDDVLEDTDI